MGNRYGSFGAHTVRSDPRGRILTILLLLLFSHQAVSSRPSCTVSRRLLRLVPAELVMLSHLLVFCRPLLFLPSIFPSIPTVPQDIVIYQSKSWNLTVCSNNNFRGNGRKCNCKSKLTWQPVRSSPSLQDQSLSRPLQDHPSPKNWSLF